MLSAILAKLPLKACAIAFAALLAVGSIVGVYLYVSHLQNALVTSQSALATEKDQRAIAEKSLTDLKADNDAQVKNLEDLSKHNEAAEAEWQSVVVDTQTIDTGTDTHETADRLNALSARLNRMLEDASAGNNGDGQD
ncbi:hypothetical protein SAMN05216548_114139 [Faunimonas pinastri]|uniref:Uncharacterized protein n=1 Tax=Faunimonas pinastri TaxID=1855383 RepID=A0A1H9N118_9HYPH|nr:hypothetical protein [Faunimonas pinastri]SER29676.1 hypothetical protein SAMN05216548_114139 [Faunimonas pinastri]